MTSDDLHEIVTLMHDQLDALEQEWPSWQKWEWHADRHKGPIGIWLAETREILGPRGKRG